MYRLTFQWNSWFHLIFFMYKVVFGSTPASTSWWRLGYVRLWDLCELDGRGLFGYQSWNLLGSKQECIILHFSSWLEPMHFLQWYEPKINTSAAVLTHLQLWAMTWILLSSICFEWAMIKSVIMILLRTIVTSNFVDKKTSRNNINNWYSRSRTFHGLDVGISALGPWSAW